MQVKDGGFAVQPKYDCPHQQELDYEAISAAMTPEFHKQKCGNCDETNENWMCLCCQKIFCSRYVNGHMVDHNKDTKHSVALSFSDASFWCYDCDSYVYSNDIRNIAKKFGEIKFPKDEQTAKQMESLAGLMKKLEIEKAKQKEAEKEPVKFTLDDLVDGLKEKKFKKIIFLTGAGISVSAGIPDFRTEGSGLYSQLKDMGLPYPEAVFTLDYLEEKPEAFYKVAKEYFSYPADPTFAHYFMRKVENNEQMFLNFTQNIDGLEAKSGMNVDKLIEAHGHTRTAHCSDYECRKEASLEEYLKHVEQEKIFRCECGKVIKPDIVFFGESLPDKFVNNVPKIKQGDLVFVMGTSLKVYPFAALAHMVGKEVPLVLVNRENPGLKRENFLFMEGNIDDQLKILADKLGWTDEINEMRQKGKYPEKKDD